MTIGRVYFVLKEFKIMNSPQVPGLSPIQQRFKVLTQECGLDFDEALHAVGRRSGGLPDYRRLTRQEQFRKVQEFISNGLTQEEGERVVGSFRADAKRPKPRTGRKLQRDIASNFEALVKPQFRGLEGALK